MDDSKIIENLYSRYKESCNEIEAVFKISRLGFQRVLKYLHGIDPNLSKNTIIDKSVNVEGSYAKFRLTEG